MRGDTFSIKSFSLNMNSESGLSTKHFISKFIARAGNNFGYDFIVVDM